MMQVEEQYQKLSNVMGVPLTVSPSGYTYGTRAKRWHGGINGKYFNVSCDYTAVVGDAVHGQFRIVSSNLRILTVVDKDGNVALHFMDTAAYDKDVSRQLEKGATTIDQLLNHTPPVIVKSFMMVDDVWGEYPPH